ncbi:MAG: transposase, partial [Pseudomonadota bacterium]
MSEIIAMDSDPPWKDILERYFARFIEFFFPHIFSEIDWERGHEFLDKELQKIMRSSKTGRRTVDKLVKVRLKNGSEIWAL